MSDEKEDFNDLLGNFKKSLKVYSIKELNKILINGLNSKNDKKKEIDFVLKSVADKHSISVRTLKRAASRGRIKDAKEICYCLLHLDLDISQRHISERIFFNWQTSVGNGIKRFRNINPKVKIDAEFKDSYQQAKEQLLKFIEENNKTNI